MQYSLLQTDAVIGIRCKNLKNISKPVFSSWQDSMINFAHEVIDLTPIFYCNQG